MHTNSAISSLAVLLSTLLLGAAPQDAKPAAAGKFVLEVGEHELTKVIEASGKFLDRTYLLAPSELGEPSPKVKLPRRLELDAAGCEAVVSQLAYTEGLVATPLDRGRGLWEFVNMSGPKRGEIMTRAIAATPEEVRRMRDVRVCVSTQVILQHARASVVTQTMRPFFASSGAVGILNIGTAGNERVILLSGMSDSVAQAMGMIAEVDQPEPLGKVEDDRLTSLEKRMSALEEAIKRLEGSKPK